MKKLLILLILLLPFFANGQGFVREYIFSNGWKIKVWDTIRLGKGSLPNGGFKYVKSGGFHVSGDKAGTLLKVRVEFYNAFRRTVYLVLRDKNKHRYTCKTEYAINSKELVPPPGYWNYHLINHAKPVSYRDTIPINASKEMLFTRAKSWAVTNFKKPTGAIQKINQDKSELVIDVAIPYHSRIQFANSATQGYIYYTLKMFFRNGSYIYWLTDFRHKAYNTCTQLYHSNQLDPYNFDLLTTEPDCPNPKVYPYNGRRWSDKVWHELKRVADSAAQVQISNIKMVMNQ